MRWKGSGIYRVTTRGKATLSITGESNSIIDCTTNDIRDLTYDTDGNEIKETIIQYGCGGSSSSLTYVSIKITPISGGFQDYSVQEDSDSNQYRSTFTFQKQ